MSQTLKTFIGGELTKPCDPAARTLAETLSKDFNGSVEAVLYYGSCLRTGEIDGLILDFYVLVEDYKKAHHHFFSTLGNKLVPPNVYYREIPFKGKKIRAKVAVLTLNDFLKRVGDRGLNVSIWARFSQPSRLGFSKNRTVAEVVTGAICEAHKTMLKQVLPLHLKTPTPQMLWREGLKKTYGAEMRSEDPEKGNELFLLNKAYYEAVTPLVLLELEDEIMPSPKALKARWRWRRLNGKFVSLLRLIKAMFTFQGGIDYLAWKIQRSSGVEVVIKPWHRKVPLLAGVILFIQLRLKGAFR